MRIATLPQQREKGLAHWRSMNAQVKGLSVLGWRYLPLTRTRHKLLTCVFATTRRSPTLRPSAKRPGSLRDYLDDGDIDGLITTYREGIIAVSLAAAHNDAEEGSAGGAAGDQPVATNKTLLHNGRVGPQVGGSSW
jgi:hypothetical protein